MDLSEVDVEQLIADLRSGKIDDLPDIEVGSIKPFVKFMVGIAMYMAVIGEFMESVNKRLEVIELRLMDKDDQVGSA